MCRDGNSIFRNIKQNAENVENWIGMSLGMHQDIHITERLTRIDDGT